MCIYINVLSEQDNYLELKENRAFYVLHVLHWFSYSSGYAPLVQGTISSEVASEVATTVDTLVGLCERFVNIRSPISPLSMMDKCCQTWHLMYLVTYTTVDASVDQCVGYFSATGSLTL